jgi:hypothetical protein
MMQRLVASKQTVMQLLVGYTRACMVVQPAQRFSSVVNVETVSRIERGLILIINIERVLNKEEEGKEGSWRGFRCRANLS